MKLLPVIFFMLLSKISIAQKVIPDTLTTAETIAVNLAYRNSCFGQLILTDSCSRMGDSAAAGEYMMRVNPYYLMSENLTPATIDSFITHHYKIPVAVRHRYTDSFTTIYNKPRSKAYETFEKMFAEDQAVRQQSESCNDSLSCTVASEQMYYTDSVHFAYLLRYVHQYGWPAIANGGLYASVIALHDHRHHKLYRPLILQATLNGEVNKQILDLLYLWLSRNLSLDIQLSKYRYTIFDVTDILKYKTPHNLPEIDKTISAHCPVYWYWNIQYEKNITEKGAHLEFLLDYYGKVLTNAVKEMADYNCH